MSDRSAPSLEPGATANPTAPISLNSLPLRNCPRCGGSGQLRTGHGAYRSCLDCAARGTVTAA